MDDDNRDEEFPQSRGSFSVKPAEPNEICASNNRPTASVQLVDTSHDISTECHLKRSWPPTNPPCGKVKIYADGV